MSSLLAEGSFFIDASKPAARNQTRYAQMQYALFIAYENVKCVGVQISSSTWIVFETIRESRSYTSTPFAVQKSLFTVSPHSETMATAEEVSPCCVGQVETSVNIWIYRLLARLTHRDRGRNSISSHSSLQHTHTEILTFVENHCSAV